MILSNIQSRGYLKGTIYRGAGTGTTDYNDLSNKPQINDNTLQGNQSGDDLGLINSADLSFNVGYAGNILHNIKYKNNTYNTYAEPFTGASSGTNGKMGLVPAPLSSQSDFNKFLKGNGTWANIMSYDNLYHNRDNTTGVKQITLNHSLDNYAFLFFVYVTPSEGAALTAPSPLQPVIPITDVVGAHKYSFINYTSYGNRYIVMYSEDGVNCTLQTGDYGGSHPLSVYDIYGVKIGNNNFQ